MARKNRKPTPKVKQIKLDPAKRMRENIAKMKKGPKPKSSKRV